MEVVKDDTEYARGVSGRLATRQTNIVHSTEAEVSQSPRELFSPLEATKGRDTRD